MIYFNLIYFNLFYCQSIYNEDANQWTWTAEVGVEMEVLGPFGSVIVSAVCGCVPAWGRDWFFARARPALPRKRCCAAWYTYACTWKSCLGRFGGCTRLV